MGKGIRPNLWFDTEAEEAARFYTGVFRDSELGTITHYPAVGQEVHGKPAGSVLTVEFKLNGQSFIALNGGPDFKFNEAISLEVECADQDEVDYYWEKLSEGGEHGPCGGLKDRFGVSWQVVPTRLNELIADPDAGRAHRATQAMMAMKKLDIAELERAADAVPA